MCIRDSNKDAAILTTPWDELDGKTILAAMEKVSLADELMEKIRAEHEADEHEHHHCLLYTSMRMRSAFCRRSSFLPPMIWIPRCIPCRTASTQ